MSRRHGFSTFLIFQFLRFALTAGLVCSGERAEEIQQTLDREPLKCCVNHYEVNGTCLECPNGWFGHNCSVLCPEGFYGRLCRKACNCSSEHECDHVNGCILLSTVHWDISSRLPNKNSEMNNNDEHVVSTWVWILVVMITLLICGIGTVVAIRTIRKRSFPFDIITPVPGQQKIEAYSIQRLSKLNEHKDISDDLQYAEIVRDGTKSKYDTGQSSSKPKKNYCDQNSSEPKSKGNIYSTHILPDADYDKLQFHPQDDVVLHNELDLYDVTVQKS